MGIQTDKTLMCNRDMQTIQYVKQDRYCETHPNKFQVIDQACMTTLNSVHDKTTVTDPRVERHCQTFATKMVSKNSCDTS